MSRARLREAMHQAIGEPRITLRAAPDVIAALEAALADIAHEEGYDGRVHDRRRSRASAAPIAASNGAAAARTQRSRHRSGARTR